MKQFFFAILIIGFSFLYSSCNNDWDVTAAFDCDYEVNRDVFSPGDTLIASFNVKNVKCEKKVEIESVNSYLGYKKIASTKGRKLQLSYVLPSDLKKGTHSLLFKIAYYIDGEPKSVWYSNQYLEDEDYSPSMHFEFPIKVQ